MKTILHWNEGLFLQPHHLQQLQRSVSDSIQCERKLTWMYPYGLIESQLLSNDLDNMRIRFEKLSVIMPSGLVVDFPDNADLPSLDIKEAFTQNNAGFTVYLAIPLWDSQRANTMDTDQSTTVSSKLLYRLKETEVRDENTGHNPKPMVCRRINARLTLENEDTTDMETLPLLKIIPAAGEDIGKPKQYLNFAPPCFVLRGSTILHDLVRDLVSQIEVSRKELTVQINQGGFSMETVRGLKLEQMLRLRTLNQFSARLMLLMAGPTTPPFPIYIELQALLGELAGLHPDRELFELSPYSHDDPFPCFKALAEKIRNILKGGVVASFKKIDFALEEGLFVATLEDDDFTKPSDYYIAIQTQEEPRTVTELVENVNQFKFIAHSYANRPIRGIKLQEERIPPMEFPAQVGLHFYHVLKDESSRMWDILKQGKKAVVRWPSMENSDFKITLYMTVPNES